MNRSGRRPPLLVKVSAVIIALFIAFTVLKLLAGGSVSVLSITPSLLPLNMIAIAVGVLIIIFASAASAASAIVSRAGVMSSSSSTTTSVDNAANKSNRKIWGCATRQTASSMSPRTVTDSGIPFVRSREVTTGDPEPIWIRTDHGTAYTDYPFYRHTLRCVRCGARWPVFTEADYAAEDEERAPRKGWHDEPTSKTDNGMMIYHNDALTRLSDLNVRKQTALGLPPGSLERNSKHVGEATVDSSLLDVSETVTDHEMNPEERDQ